MTNTPRSFLAEAGGVASALAQRAIYSTRVLLGGLAKEVHPEVGAPGQQRQLLEAVDEGEAPVPEAYYYYGYYEGYYADYPGPKGLGQLNGGQKLLRGFVLLLNVLVALLVTVWLRRTAMR